MQGGLHLPQNRVNRAMKNSLLAIVCLALCGCTALRTYTQPGVVPGGITSVLGTIRGASVDSSLTCWGGFGLTPRLEKTISFVAGLLEARSNSGWKMAKQAGWWVALREERHRWMEIPTSRRRPIDARVLPQVHFGGLHFRNLLLTLGRVENPEML